MGLLDFVKSGVREMMIARPDDNADLIYKHPDRTIPMFAQATVRADEWAVFAKEGRPMGTLDAGRHTLSAQSIPFLSNLIDSFTGGNVLLAELYFVKRTPFPMKFGGSLGNMIDPLTQIRIRARCHGSLLLRVENPEKMIFGYFGNRKFQEHPDIYSWFTDSFFLTVKNTLGRFAKERGVTLMDIMGDTAELTNALVANAADLAEVGMRIVKVTEFDVDVPEEDAKRFDEMNQRLADQKIGMATDAMQIKRAELQAQAKQFQLDQQYQQDARYVQNLAGNFQNYAAGQAMIGAGQGMAKGGEGAGPAGAAAQFGVGMGIAGMYAQGMQQQGAPQFNPANAPRVGVPGAPGAAPAGGAAPTMVRCPGCGANVPPGKFCAECGTTLQAAGPKKCSSCGAELSPGAKFCPECGTSANAPAR